MLHGPAFYRLLHHAGISAAGAPATLREAQATGQRSPEELIDQYALACRPVRDLLVDYLKERQPALDYTSLRSLAYDLGMGFWKDIERHHPAVDSLHLPSEVAHAWKTRLRTRPKTVTAEDGSKTVVTVERISFRQCLTPARALWSEPSMTIVTTPMHCWKLPAAPPQGQPPPSRGRP